MIAKDIKNKWAKYISVRRMCWLPHSEIGQHLSLSDYKTFCIKGLVSLTLTIEKVNSQRRIHEDFNIDL
jgi:hypothetical protein